MLRRSLAVVLLMIATLLAIGVPVFSFEYLVGVHEKSLNLPFDGFKDGVRYTWGYPIRRNRLGFREREFEVPKPAGVTRVMVLGDSLTFGIGLPEERRFTNLAEAELVRRSGTSVEVLNFGSPGFSTVRQLEVLQRHGIDVAPDLLVVAFCFNDPQQKEQDYSPERARFKEENSWIRTWRQDVAFWGFPRLAQIMERAVWRVAELRGIVPEWQVALARSYDQSSKDWKEFVSALDGIKGFAERQGMPTPLFIVLNQGASSVTGTDYKNPDPALQQLLHWWRQAESTARKLGYVTYNHEAEIAAKANGENMAINVKDGHPSAHLHAIYADKLANEVTKYLRTDGELG